MLACTCSMKTLFSKMIPLTKKEAISKKKIRLKHQGGNFNGW
ncbi:hypothetical protein SB48_HM08orf02000 [Heyndrickxia coagulans]|uniref:Uncharacterized protein n=1 Tax=Heyndrickxia coagulans TaxID=1398 RepID=A0AAN0T3B3_HEYCO|nr:hypothetical protein SB48_HM08orf02000 [Heyndrickxia coagulans]